MKGTFLLSAPPRDAQGEVTWHDHPGIQSESILLRGVPQDYVIEKGGGPRISSMLYQGSSLGNRSMSVDLGQLIEKRGIPANEYIKSKPWIGIVGWSAKQVRQMEFQVGYDPLPENVFHGAVWGEFRRAQKKQLAASASWIVNARGVSLVG